MSFNHEGRKHGTIEPDSSGEMADGDPVTATAPVKNGNRCQFLSMECTSLPPLPVEAGSWSDSLCKLGMSLCDETDILIGLSTPCHILSPDCIRAGVSAWNSIAR